MKRGEKKGEGGRGRERGEGGRIECKKQQNIDKVHVHTVYAHLYVAHTYTSALHAQVQYM